MYDAPAAVYGTSGYHFTSKEQDGESGLDYFLARHYSSAVGPFHVDRDAPGLKHLGCATLGVGCK